MTPLISVVIPTKNSLPHLKRAIEGIRRQIYKNFELIVQDGGSTDGTLEYLSTIQDFPKIDIRSEPDSGIGQAYNRGISRSNGDYIFLAASDEYLFDDALKNLIYWYQDHPSAAVIYGGVLLVNQQGEKISRFSPVPYDFLKFMRCEVFPSTAGLLNRRVIGADLFYDESLKTCPDYDFWLRLGYRFPSHQIIHRSELIMTSLADRTSMSYRAESFEQFCKDKLFILERFLADKTNELGKVHFKAKAGIFTWAAKEVMGIEELSSNAINFFEEAENCHLQVDTPPPSVQDSKIALFITYFDVTNKWMPRLRRWCLNKKTHILIKRKLIFYVHLVGTIFKKDWLSTCRKQLFNIEYPIRIQGGMNSWGYIAEVGMTEPLKLEPNTRYWIEIHMKVMSGVIGVLFMDKKTVQKEKLFPLNTKEIITYYALDNCKDFSIIFRNGGLKNSVMEIYELSIVKASFYESSS